MPSISNPIKERVIEEIKLGSKQTDVAKNYKIARSSVQNIIKKHKKGLGVENLPKTGRKRKLTERDERHLAIISKHNPTLTAISFVVNLTSIIKCLCAQ